MCRHWARGACNREENCKVCHHPEETPTSTDCRPPAVPAGWRDDKDPWEDQDPWKSWPIFEWIEDEAQIEQHSIEQKQDHVFNHSEVRISEEEDGLLVDTGARRNLSGLSLIERQSKASSRFGFVTKWVTLE